VDDNSYRKLDAWKKAMDAYDAIYTLSGGFPPEERSLFETETKLIAAVRNAMCTRPAALSVWDQLQHAGRLLNGLVASLAPET